MTVRLLTPAARPLAASGLKRALLAVVSKTFVPGVARAILDSGHSTAP